MNRRFLGATAVLFACAAAMLPAGGQAPAPVFGTAHRLRDSAGGTEPRVDIDAKDRRWLVTNASDRDAAVVYVSSDRGATWTRTGSDFPGQTSPTIDVDVVVTRTGRIIATELDFAGINFPTAYSDDGGATWTQSRGTVLADQDRQWLAVGPDDPVTHQPRVYLLYHNLLTGAGHHNMWVMTSTDGGATFGPPIPITMPGDQAFLDLQCADSGGPGGLVVNRKTGRLYAFFGTRSSAVAGGCGAQPVEVNIVAATRVWVATSPDGSAGSWTQSLAVDNSTTGQIVGMQLATGALDRAGNVYVAYPESPRPYPDFSGAALKVRWAGPDMADWSDPITVVPAGGAGIVTPHILAGDPGKFNVAYFAGVTRGSAPPLWYATVAQTLDGMSTKPHFSYTRLSPHPTYEWTANEMMGACATGPAQGIQNGFMCNRATDVWGVALDARCMLTVTWPSVRTTVSALDATWVATQTAGSTLCGTTQAPPARVLPNRQSRGVPTPATGIAPGWLGLPVVAAAITLRRLLRAA